MLQFVSRSPRYAARTEVLFVSQAARPGKAAERSVAKAADGVCVFRENRRCAIHADAGEEVLPVGCRHYPRVVRIDPDRIALSLSHYCPTAASLLVSDAPIQIVTAAPPLALSEPLEGMDVREALPPLLGPDLLMDRDGYAAWEEAAVRSFSTADRADVALERIATATDVLRQWRPGSSSLREAVARAFAGGHPTAPAWMRHGLPIARRLNRGIISLESSPTGSAQPVTDAAERIIANYLAARVFANWIAYQGRGLRTIVTWLSACHEVVRLLMARGTLQGPAHAIEAIRQADYVMLHTIDTQEFADAARGVEG